MKEQLVIGAPSIDDLSKKRRMAEVANGKAMKNVIGQALKKSGELTA